MLPDIVQDSVTDAAKRIGAEFIEAVFFKAAVMSNLDNPADRALSLSRVWHRTGYDSLPGVIKDAILKINDGEVH